MAVKHNNDLLVGERAPADDKLGWWNDHKLVLCPTFECWTGTPESGLQIYNTTIDYGMRRGLWNILDVLSRHAVTATFFVDGLAAVRFPAAVSTIVDQGHEVAPLGYGMKAEWHLPIDEERAFIVKSIETIEQVTGKRPDGWRTPFSRLSLNTLKLLVEQGITWDSSIRNDEVPYLVSIGDRTLTEIPFGGATDYRYYSGFPTPPVLPPIVEPIFLDELDIAYSDSQQRARMLSLTFNPSFTGRPMEIGLLERLLSKAKGLDATCVATCGELAGWIRAHEEFFDETNLERGVR